MGWFRKTKAPAPAQRTAAPLAIPPRQHEPPYVWVPGLFGDATPLNHRGAGFSLAIPGFPRIAHAMSSLRDIEWDMRAVPSLCPTVTVRVRHVPMRGLPDARAATEGAIAAIAAMRNPSHKTYDLARDVPIVPPGTIAASRGVVRMSIQLPAAAGGARRRTDDILVVAHPEVGLVIVETSYPVPAPLGIGVFLRALHETIEWHPRREPSRVMRTPAESFFLSQTHMPQLRSERVMELPLLIAELGRSSAAERDALMPAFEPLSVGEPRTEGDQPVARSTIEEILTAPIGPLQDRVNGSLRLVKTTRDLHGAAILWAQALLAAIGPDHGSTLAAPGPLLAIQPSRAIEIAPFAVRAQALITREEAREIRELVEFYPNAADAPDSAAPAKLIEGLVQSVERSVSTPEVAQKLRAHLAEVQTIRDLQAMALWWLAVVGQLDEHLLKKEWVPTAAPDARLADDEIRCDCGRVMKRHFKFCFSCSKVLPHMR